MQFDYPDANVHSSTRSATTTAVQKLFIMNNQFMAEQSKRLAKRVAGNKMTTPEQVHKIYSLLYGRKPSTTELDIAFDFLRLPSESKLTRWEQYSHALLAANEMNYID